MILPAWSKWAALGVLLLAASHLTAYWHGIETEASRRDATQATDQVTAVSSVRTEEHRRTDDIEQVRQNAHPKLEAIRNNGADASVELERLRQTANSYAERLATCTPAAERGKTATAAAMVLSDLLGRSEARNVELAAAFDDARQRGLTCEAQYQALERIKLHP